MIAVLPGAGTFTGTIGGFDGRRLHGLRGGAAVIAVLPGAGTFTGTIGGLTAIGFMAFAGVQP